MIRLADYIRLNVEFPAVVDGNQFNPAEQVIFSGRAVNDLITIVQILDNGGQFNPGGKFNVSNVQILSRSETSGGAYDLLHSIYDSPAMGGNPSVKCYSNYMNSFVLPGISRDGFDLPDLHVASMHPAQRPQDLGAVDGAYIWSVNYTLTIE